MKMGMRMNKGWIRTLCTWKQTDVRKMNKYGFKWKVVDSRKKTVGSKDMRVCCSDGFKVVC